LCTVVRNGQSAIFWMVVNVESEFFYMHGAKNFSNGTTKYSLGNVKEALLLYEQCITTLILLTKLCTQIQVHQRGDT